MALLKFSAHHVKNGGAKIYFKKCLNHETQEEISASVKKKTCIVMKKGRAYTKG